MTATLSMLDAGHYNAFSDIFAHYEDDDEQNEEINDTLARHATLTPHNDVFRNRQPTTPRADSAGDVIREGSLLFRPCKEAAWVPYWCVLMCDSITVLKEMTRQFVTTIPLRGHTTHLVAAVDRVSGPMSAPVLSTRPVLFSPPTHPDLVSPTPPPHTTSTPFCFPVSTEPASFAAHTRLDMLLWLSALVRASEMRSGRTTPTRTLRPILSTESMTQTAPSVWPARRGGKSALKGLARKVRAVAGGAGVGATGVGGMLPLRIVTGRVGA